MCYLLMEACPDLFRHLLVVSQLLTVLSNFSIQMRDLQESMNSFYSDTTL